MGELYCKACILKRTNTFGRKLWSEWGKVGGEDCSLHMTNIGRLQDKQEKVSSGFRYSSQ